MENRIVGVKGYSPCALCLLPQAKILRHAIDLRRGFSLPHQEEQVSLMEYERYNKGKLTLIISSFV